MVIQSHNLFYQYPNADNQLLLVLTEEQKIKNALEEKRNLLSMYKISDLTPTIVGNYLMGTIGDYLIAYYMNQEIEMRKKALGTFVEKIEIPYELYEWKEDFLNYHLENDIPILQKNFRQYWLKLGKGYYKDTLLFFYIKNELGISSVIHLEAS